MAPHNRPGVFVSVDGPGGVGKSTLITAVGVLLAEYGLAPLLTTEPTRTPLGDLIRHGTHTYTGRALACLVAGDRQHHVATVIRPARAAGQVVISDRYLPSSLVLQRIDGLAWESIIDLDRDIDPPDLAVILNADPAVIAGRLHERGGHSRFEQLPDSSRTESELYLDTARRLASAGWNVWVLDCTSLDPQHAARQLAERIVALQTDRPAPFLRSPHGPVAADLEPR